jgi:hypothetical protein
VGLTLVVLPFPETVAVDLTVISYHPTQEIPVVYEILRGTADLLPYSHLRHYFG